LLFVAGLARTSTSQEPPNFIVFVADDMAWEDCGAYGHPNIQTPHMDRLAREGMKFDAAFLTCSSCSPSRCSILTGRYPHATGAGELHQPLPQDQTLFTEP
ncbi:MAG: sulfatase-like hydrolase/transferase, partial [Planctomycetota bacterium]|nr:sulfatase-like hydrolase/transferase [Planctomycetota bacterium]